MVSQETREVWMATKGRAPTKPVPRSTQTGLDLPLALPARALWLALALVLAVLFITDLRAPLGALDSIPYVLAVVLSLALPRGYEPVVVAASCTAITVVSVFFAPQDGMSRGPTLLHTGLPIFVVWATAWLALRYRRVGQAMRAADAQIQLAAVAVGFGTFDFDPVSGIKRWSPGARRIVGLENEPTFTFERLISVIHQDDVQRVLDAMRAGEDPRGAGQFEDEHRIVRPDGTIRWVLVKSRTVFAGEGPQRHAIHVSGVVVDITDRRRAEEALRQSEERLRLLTERFQTALQASPVVAFNQDRDLRYTWIYNPLFGHDPESVIGLRDRDLFERSVDAAATEAVKREVLQTGEARRAEVRVRHDGVEHVYDLTVQPLLDGTGRVDGVTCAAIEITDAKRSEEALRTRNERLRLLSTTASHLVLRGTALQTSDTDNILSAVFANVARTLRVEMHLHYRASEPGVLRLISSSGLSESTRLAAATIRLGDSLCGAVAASRTRLIVEDLQASTLETARLMRALGVRSYAGFPLLVGGRVVATASFATAHRGSFEPDEIALMQTVCDLVSAALARDELAQSLQDSEERLRMANEAAGIGTFDIDLVAARARYSPQLCAIAGVPPHTETSVDGFLAFLHPEDRENAVARFKAASQPDSEGAFGSELRIVRADGRVRWLTWSGRLVFGDLPDGRRPVRVIGAVLDITERKRADEALADREALYRTLAEAMPHIVYTTGPDGEADYVNSRWFEYAGIDPATDGRFDWTARLHPDDSDRTQQAWRTSLATGDPFTAEFRFMRGDGEYRWHSSRALPIRNDAGEVVRWIGTFTDVHDVTLAAAALKDADRRKDEFLATLAHELRNPLSPMRIAVTLLGRRGQEDPELSQLRLVIERQVEHLTRLVDDLLDVSRITRDKLTLRKEQVDLATVIHDAVEAARPEIDRHGHHLTVAIAGESFTAECDVVRITQVFSNLLHNAAKYTPRGGSIWVIAERDGSEAVVRVRDTGVGIAPEKVPRLFEMFYQADPSLDRSDGGLGIGLTLVHRLLEMHGGSVEARSPGAGLGSEFVVRLPLGLTSAALPVHAQVPPEVPAIPTGMRVLVVDDNRDSADMLRALLEACGNTVYTAYDGGAALTVAEAKRPEAILLDIGLPGVNGYEVCRRLRQQAWCRDTLVVAQTGWGQDQDLRRSREAGFDAHFTKPVDDEALLKLLAEWGPAGERRSSHDTARVR
jgi:PAS domain S-box-containing protein